MPHNYPHLFSVLSLTAGLLIGCSQPAPPVPEVKIPDVQMQSAVSTSTTSILVTLKQSPDAAAIDPGRYVLTSAGTPVAVRRAFPIAGGKQVLLETAAQGTATLHLKRGDGDPELDLPPSSVVAPAVKEVLALNHTQVLLRFTASGGAVQLHRATETPSLYHLDDLNVTSVKLSADKSAVVLTTTGQESNVYRLDAAGLYTEDYALTGTMGSSFTGIPVQDTSAPRVTGTDVPDRQTVVVRFSEPLKTVDVSNFSIRDESNLPLRISRAVFTDEFRTAVQLTTEPQQDGKYALQVQGVVDGQDNAIGASSSTASFMGSGKSDTSAPTIRGVQSVSATTVQVTFSKPVRGGTGEDGAENPSNYTIHGAAVTTAAVKPAGTASNLLVTAVKLSEDQRSVTLTTLEQADISYDLGAVNIRDLVGNVIDTTTGIQRQQLAFRGTAPGGGGVDTDGDGLSDSAEQMGWKVTVKLPDGHQEIREVTSDPRNPDTDGDCLKKAEVNDSCLTDKDERALGLDPRSLDTDGDGLGDNQEYNLIFSDPLNADTDGDGLGDGAEFSFFKTSPLLADTDGDQFKDGDEINTTNRNPLIADLPRLQIKIGDIALTLNESYSYTDQSGKSQSISDSTSTTLEQSNERKYGTSDSATLTSSIEASVKTGITAEFPETFGASVETELKGSEQREYNTTTSKESSASSTEAYNKSFDKVQSIDSSSAVTRTVNGAAMRLSVTLANDSNTAYTVKNLEITALEQNPFDRSSFIPVATLVSEAAQISNGQVVGGAPSYNLGPLVPALGPFLFKNSDVFPKTIENLMREPHGLVFQVANYDITDEAGRNFAFASREAYDRTAELVVDFGDGRVLRYRVATASNFDGAGKAKGISMKYALSSILGLDYATGTVSYAPAKVLTRVQNVSNQPGQHKAWTLLTSKTPVPNVDFDDIVLKGGDSYSLAFLEDVDQDNLFASEEYLYGSSDQCDNSDGVNSNGSLCPTAPDGQHDTLSDYQEVREGWTVQVIGKTAYKVFSDPRRADSDNDGLLDDKERALGTDPRKRDTDEDGLSDFEEIYGFTERYKGDAVPTDGIKTNPLNPDSDGDGLSDGFERKIGSKPNTADATKFVDTDQDGVSDYDESNGFQTTVNGVSVAMKSFNDRADSDGDGLPDLLEHLLKTNPQSNDTDSDGLTDAQEFDPATFTGFNAFVQACKDAKNCVYTLPTAGEVAGTDLLKRDTDGDTLDDKTEFTIPWMVNVVGADGTIASTSVKSSPVLADKDGDGWNDAKEKVNGTNPNSADTDGDGSNDNLDGDRCGSKRECASSLVMDQQITITFKNIYVRRDGDNGGNPGDFYFQMTSSVPAVAGNNGDVIANTTTSNLVPNCNGDQSNRPCYYEDTFKQIAISDGEILNVNRSITYIKKYYEPLSLYYFIQELDNGGAQFSHEFSKKYTGQIKSGDDKTRDFNDRYIDQKDCSLIGTDCSDLDTDVGINVSIN